MGKIIILLLSVLGLGSGVAGGLFMRPESNLGSAAGADTADGREQFTTNSEAEGALDPDQFDFVRINNQFIIPIVDEARVSSLVVLSLTLQVTAGQTDAIYSIEPKLRDELLQVMFDHANAGGFDGPFTEATRMQILRNALIEVSRKVAGENVIDVLITNVVRQDV